jgi:hypothetical protein
MTKHAPGPWLRRDRGGETQVEDAEGGVVVVVPMRAWRPLSEDLASAALIAGAPDLLEAAKQMLRAIREVCPRGGHVSEIEEVALQSAIDAAEGRS